MSKSDEGKKLFQSGYNCAQSVMGAFAEEMNITLEEAAKIASPFGGGMGRMREVCGAVSGMFMVLGKLCGYDTPNPEAQKKLYAAVQSLAGKFSDETGSLICKELLGLSKKENDPTPDRRTQEYYKKRPCAELVALACDILEEYLKNKE